MSGTATLTPSTTSFGAGLARPRVDSCCGGYLWLPTVRTQVKRSTKDAYERIARNHLIPRLGRRQLSTNTASDLNKVYADLLVEGRGRGGKPGLSVKTVRNVHTMISKVVSDAVQDGLLPRNVATLARPPKVSEVSPGEIKFWTADQLGSFLARIRDDAFFPEIHLAAYTGMRRGEVLACVGRTSTSMPAVCPSARASSLWLTRSRSTPPTPKTRKARVIDLDPSTLEVLKAQRLRQKRLRFAFGPGYEPSDLVFTREDGRAIHPERLSQVFDRLVRLAGLPRIRLHDLRHTHATLLLISNVATDASFDMVRDHDAIRGLGSSMSAAVG
jgi:integrase